MPPPAYGYPYPPPGPGQPYPPPHHPYPPGYPGVFYPMDPAYFYPPGGVQVVDNAEPAEIVPQLPGETVELPWSKCSREITPCIILVRLGGCLCCLVLIYRN